jgi:hypothetical protein
MAEPDQLILKDGCVECNPAFQQQMLRLHHVTVCARWMVTITLWVCIAPICLWNLRSEIALWLDYFTWTAVRFSLIYNPLSALGLLICIGTTVSVLLWQSRNILLGISDRQTRRLKKQLFKIHQQGTSHPLWKWVCKDRD